jgi:hypothetical protein
MRRVKPVLFFAANLIALSPAQAAGATAEAGITWRLGFGGAGPVETGYGLIVGYRSADLGGLSGQLLEFDVSSRRGALARLAGVPLAARSHAAHQNDLDPPEDSPAHRPWYTRQWVWWTIGGVAATAALGGVSFSSSAEGGGTTVVSTGPRGCSGGGNVGPQDIPETCTPETEGGTVVGTDEDGNVCVIDGFGNPEDVCAPTGFAGRPGSRFAGRASDAWFDAWLDAGTGGMGDLIAR